MYSDPLCFNANSGHCTITESTKYHINLADNDKLLTRQMLSTKTILVRGRMNLNRPQRVKKLCRKCFFKCSADIEFQSGLYYFVYL